MTMPRSGLDWEGLMSLMNASDGLGEVEISKGLAQWLLDGHAHHESPDWFTEGLKACSLAVLGRHAEALAMLERTIRSPRLVPAYFLEHSLCFGRYAEDARYQGVVDHFEARRAALRARLPTTLAELGVSL